MRNIMMGVIGVMGLLIFFLYNQMNYNKEMLLIETVKNSELTVALEETKNSLTKQIEQLNSLSSKNQQYEAEMAQLENEIQSRQFESEEFYDNSLAGLANEADARMQELEARRISEDWSDERYQNELSEYDQWYLDRTYEIQSDYDGRIREIEFDQRQHENLQTVVETNEIYQEGERGFFGNPIPGSVRQGGFTDDLSDPGNLAMLGIVITVGTTLLQLARGR